MCWTRTPSSRAYWNPTIDELFPSVDVREAHLGAAVGLVDLVRLAQAEVRFVPVVESRRIRALEDEVTDPTDVGGAGPDAGQGTLPKAFPVHVVFVRRGGLGRFERRLAMHDLDAEAVRLRHTDDASPCRLV